MCHISYEIADKLMFNADCAPLIQIIAIGIPLSAIHSCICGYYYGCKKTFIPAISQIIEQLIRIFSVIIYYHLISGNLETLTVLMLYMVISQVKSVRIYSALDVSM